MPILYYVPIIHSIEDYGSLGPAIAGAFIKKLGKPAFDRLQEEIREYWRLVEEKIEAMIPDVRGFIVYHDGIPVGVKEKILVLFNYMLKDHPESPNFQVVKKLLEKGAVLEGTEDMCLLKEQLELYRLIKETDSSVEQGHILNDQDVRSRELIKLRDEFIAKRIQDTLPPSGKAILFIGRDHDVIGELEKLPEKFTVICL